MTVSLELFSTSFVTVTHNYKTCFYCDQLGHNSTSLASHVTLIMHTILSLYVCYIFSVLFSSSIRTVLPETNGWLIKTQVNLIQIQSYFYCSEIWLNNKQRMALWLCQCTNSLRNKLIKPKNGKCNYQSEPFSAFLSLPRAKSPSSNRDSCWSSSPGC